MAIIDGAMNSQTLIWVAFGFIFIGMMLLAATVLLQPKKTDTKVAVVGFIGPFPIGFGNDKNLLMTALIIGMILLAFFMVYGRTIKP